MSLRTISLILWVLDVAHGRRVTAFSFQGSQFCVLKIFAFVNFDLLLTSFGSESALNIISVLTHTLSQRVYWPSNRL
jgi:hypothetical protein